MAEPPRRRAPVPPLAAGWVLATVLVLGLLVLPLGALVAAALAGGGDGLRDALDLGLPSALLNSLATAGAATLLATGIGAAAALVTERAPLRGRNLLRGAMLLPLAIPSFVAALGWTEAYGPHGIAARLFGLSLPGVYGPGGIVAVLTVEGVPLAYAVVAAALATRAERDLERAARASGAGFLTALAGITLQLLRPALVAAGLLVFVNSINSFGVPQVLGVPAGFRTLTTRIYQQLAFSAEPGAFSAALVLALVLLAIALAVAALGDRLLAGPVVVRVGGGGPEAGGGGPLAAGPALALWLYLVAGTGLPLLAVLLTALTRAAGLSPVPANWTLANFATALGGTAGPGLVHSLGLGALSASAVLAMGGLVVALGRVRGGRLLGTLVTATYALAGSGLALGILLAWGPLLRSSLALILIAYLAKFWALGHRPLAGSVDALPPELARAARASGAGPATSLGTIVLPLLRPALAASWLLVFLAALHELTISSLLYAPGAETLAVAVLNLQELGDVTVTAALAVVLTALVLGAAALLIGLPRLLRPAGGGR